MKHTSRRILLTGATGFVGSHLLRALVESGYAAEALRRADSRLDLVADVADQVRWHTADIRDISTLEDALAGVDTVIHSAALVSFQARDAARLRAINQEGTANLINVSLALGVRRFIHLSSVAALGRKPGPAAQGIDESVRIHEAPAPTAYGRSKYQAEREIWRGQAEGLSVAALYPSVILGEGRWTEGTAALFPFVQRNFGYYPRGGFGFVDVRDVARAALAVLERDRDGDRFLLNAENLSYRELFTYIARALGSPPPARALPGWLGGLLWRAEALRARLLGQEALLTRETVQTAQQVLCYDNRRSVEELALTYTPIRETVERTARAWCAQTAH